ncbi:unnamed protein product [Rotaria socialis]|uniref:Uncharacterized protein n=1 Tax=Rotaria socialis TaxID=392032 RepID=A0A820DQK8_9BILA|nr:unnamed protein product [Rotaria socialis]CAF3188475.1 unnamed protein product [Rotaria socialis]CAF3425897.1 unnamed protein product [Rotaria socialis]CAF3642434.1 unnamed protein product [Rotaria socialis]CAF4145286.1 unnamed protein product [Rotaria socialis]
MAKAESPADTPADYDDERPNHMIFWLDPAIANPAEYQHLKKAFGSNTDPRCENWTMLLDKDYDDLLASDIPSTIEFEGVIFLLQAFADEESCLAAFEKNQDKRIFFITSGLMGEKIVPKVVERYRHIFTDLITNTPYLSIYIFCHNTMYHGNWAVQYDDYVLIFDFDSDLLRRMTRDIAIYFRERGERMPKDNNIEGALKHLHWAKRLWYQYEKIKQDYKTDYPKMVSESKQMREIDELIKRTEAMLPKGSSLNDHHSNDHSDGEMDTQASEPGE